MEKQPDFLRDFTKEHSQKERDNTANEIRAKRAEGFNLRKAIEVRRGEHQKEISANDEKFKRQLETIEKLNAEIEDLNKNGFKRLLSYFKLRKIEAELVATSQEHAQTLSERDELANRSKSIGGDRNRVPVEFEKARSMVDDFYTSQREKWADTKYDTEEIKKYFSGDFLKNLSVEDYAILLRRFPNEMVTHVTRQGVRDHTGHMFHTRGYGGFSDGFQRIVEDGRLRSPLGVYLVETEKERAIARYLHLDKFEEKEKALKHLKSITNSRVQGDPGSYVDRSAVHFATEEVADEYYGSERGNEIFFAFPGAHIASQYYFSGQLNQKGGGKWNDQWVWANEEKGLDINAGLVFIPQNTPVSKDTGSRYQLDKEKKPMINEKYMNALRRLISWSGFAEFAEKVDDICLRFRIQQSESPLDTTKLEAKKEINALIEQLAKELDIEDEKLLRIILDNDCRRGLKVYKDDEIMIDGQMQSVLQEFSMLYVEAKDTIPSRQYWEDYFSLHPDKKPSKIIYYEGSDPTKALFDWKRKSGINTEYKESNDPELGISGSRVDGQSPQATAGLDRFKVLARKVIEDYYAEKEKVS